MSETDGWIGGRGWGWKRRVQMGRWGRTFAYGREIGIQPFSSSSSSSSSIYRRREMMNINIFVVGFVFVLFFNE